MKRPAWKKQRVREKNRLEWGWTKRTTPLKQSPIPGNMLVQYNVFPSLIWRKFLIFSFELDYYLSSLAYIVATFSTDNCIRSSLPSTSGYLRHDNFALFLIFIDFIGVSLVKKLYRFQVYNSITHYLYIVLCVHHHKSGLLPSPFIPVFTLS